MGGRNRPARRLPVRHALAVIERDDDQVGDQDFEAQLDEHLSDDVDQVDARVKLRQLRRRRERLDAEIAAAVHSARTDGKLSWHSVGLIFGLTSEGARQRWGRSR